MAARAPVDDRVRGQLRAAVRRGVGKGLAVAAAQAGSPSYSRDKLRRAYDEEASRVEFARRITSLKPTQILNLSSACGPQATGPMVRVGVSIVVTRPGGGSKRYYAEVDVPAARGQARLFVGAVVAAALAEAAGRGYGTLTEREYVRDFYPTASRPSVGAVSIDYAECL